VCACVWLQVRPTISHGHPSRIGGDFSAPMILERLEVLNRGMEDDILAPLRRWQEGLGVAKVRHTRGGTVAV